MKSDFIIIGTGLAGLTSALTLSKYGQVLLITKESKISGASSLAQGGIAAAVGEDDSTGLHYDDTMTAGAQYSDTESVRFLVDHGPEAISWLETQGVKFDKKGTSYALGREAAHSKRRILHITDFTGRAIVKKLWSKVSKNKNIKTLQNCFFLDLIVKDKKCHGVSVLFNNEIINCFARGVILASGGLGQVYKYTTNPAPSTGDGIAAAFRAGAKLKDLEFIQFHPTALDHGTSPLFLLSEALRGEGAVLQNYKGERFMKKYDDRLELAPRDVISRAVFSESKFGKIYLDIRRKDKKYLQKRFPNIFARLSELGYDMSRDPIPVTPAAHYSCGGIVIDNSGRTNISDLFAFGEVACTGVHGANRLASNSLLEAVVFPLQLEKAVSDFPKNIEKKAFNIPDFAPDLKFKNIKKQLQKLMWEKVGIVRTQKEMLEALSQIKKWESEFKSIKKVNRDFITQKNMLTVSQLVTEAALRRKKSLGAHFVNNSSYTLAF